MDSPGKPIRFGLLGAGNIGRRHTVQMARCGILAAIADTVEAKAGELAGAFSARAYSSLDDLLSRESIDVLAVCTPNYLHASQSVKALHHGCHVLCEKPMCLTSTDADRMMDAAREAGRYLFIVKQNRFNPPVQLVSRLLSEGRLGRVFSFQVNAFWNRPAAYYQSSDWHGKKDLDGGILFTQFSHFMDLLQWMLGEVDTVQSVRGNFMLGDLLEGEDTGAVLLRMKNGAIGTLQYSVSAYSKNMEGSLTILAEKGTIKIGGQYLNELEYFAVEGMEVPAEPPMHPANQYGYYTGSMSNHDKVYDELVKALRCESFSLASAREAAETVRLIERILTGPATRDSSFTL
jgi:predicted dehydrogenase